MDKMIDEVWKDVVGYEGLYQVSNYGRVKSLPRTRICQGIVMPVKGKEISLCNRRGYKMLCLYKDGSKKIASVHRLVAEAFIPNLEDKPCVDHIDGNRSNNFYNNLRWCTYKENINNPITYPRNRRSLQRSWDNRSRNVCQYSLDGNFIKEWSNVYQAANHFNGSCSGIKRCCVGKSRVALGYRWSYDKKENIGKIPPEPRMVKVAKMNKDGVVLGVYDSMKDAAKSTPKCTIQSVYYCTKDSNRTSFGYKFKRI